MTTGDDLRAKGNAFRALHARDHAFVIPNPWDLGSARILAGLGFEALATTSAGFAYSLGRRDYAPGPEAVLAHAKTIADATPLPVSADLENGFGRDANEVAAFYRRAGQTGIVGGSIEDWTGDPNDPIHEIGRATERVRAAVEAVRALPFPFTLTARAENFLRGRPDLPDTIRRLQAYQEAGADVLYAPALVRDEDIAAVVKEVDRPVNVLGGLPGMTQDLAKLSALGVKRVSLGSTLASVAYGALLNGAKELKEKGSFGFAQGAVSGRELAKHFVG